MMATVNEDSLASDELLHSLDLRTNEELSCPLCLKLFRSPRQLPCTHSFCEACLQSHISKTVPERLLCGEFHCPVCESKVSLPAEYSVEKWASLFPVSTILLYMLFREKKVHGEIKCDACNSENIATQAEGYCFDCNEARCTDCLQSHRKEKILKVHNVISIDAFNTKPECLNTFGSDFRCDVHANETLTHTCNNHRVRLCSTCREIDHKICPNVTELDKETPRFFNYQQLHQIQQEIKNCDDEVTKLLAIIQTNLNSLKSQAKEIIDQIKDFRKRINYIFDDLEKTLQQDADRIYEEQLLKMQEKKRNCQSLKVAMKNTHLLYKFFNENGKDVQKHILADKVKHHTSLLQKRIDSTGAQNKAPTFHLEINPKLQLMLAIPTKLLASVNVRRQEGEIIVSDELKALKVCCVKLVDSFAVRGIDKPSNVAYISKTSIILTKWNYCQIFDLSSELSTEYYMPEGCDDSSHICITGDNEIAVSFPTLGKVFLFSVLATRLSIKDTFKTRKGCSGIIAVSREEIVVSGQCNDGKHFYWSLVTLKGKEKSYHEFDGHGEKRTYLALNSHKTLLYMCIYNGDSLYCFGLDGTVYYNITPKGLVCVAGLTLDRDDNVYVVGKRSGNIFQISPEGEVLKIFTEGIPLSPSGICFNPTGDKFICIGRPEKLTFIYFRTKLLQMANLYLFQLI